MKMLMIKAFTLLLLLAGIFSVPLDSTAQESTDEAPDGLRIMQTTPPQTTTPAPYIVQVSEPNQLPFILSIAALVIALVGIYTKASVPVTILRVENVPVSNNSVHAARLQQLIDEGTDYTLQEIEQAADQVITTDPLKIADMLRAGQSVVIPGATDYKALLDAMNKGNAEAVTTPEKKV